MSELAPGTLMQWRDPAPDAKPLGIVLEPVTEDLVTVLMTDRDGNVDQELFAARLEATGVNASEMVMQSMEVVDEPDPELAARLGELTADQPVRAEPLVRAGIEEATPMGHYAVGPYDAYLISDIESGPAISYTWGLVVTDAGQPHVRLLVTAEHSDFAAGVAAGVIRDLGALGPNEEPPRFLCTFDEAGSHSNYGTDWDLSTAEAFLEAAIPLAARSLGVNG